MYRSYFIFLFLCGVLFGEEPFSAKIEISNQKISILDHLKMTILLKHPAGVHVDIAKIRSNLLDYAGIDGPLWTIKHENVKEGAGETQAVFELTPWRDGKLPLAARDIHFVDKEGKQVTAVIADVFMVTVDSVKVQESYQGQIAPLMPLSHPFPIDLSMENRIMEAEKIDEIPMIVVFRERFFYFLNTAVVMLILVGFIYACNRVES